ncbi:MAG: transglycosylase domain-containing protein, partial [Acetobacteraceae bacterium]|nr:transglycosylase domain-containing protein [Acetobacteraceae bacterium]
MTAPLTPGERLAASSPGSAKPQPRDTASEPSRRRVRSPLRWLARALGALLGMAVLLALIGIVVAYGAYRHFAGDLPDVEGLRSYQPRVMSRVFASDARPMAELATERRIFVPYAAIPDVVKRAFVSAEDQNFWIHRGVDPLAMARAALTDLHQMGQGRRPVGASTITQQVAKNMLLDSQVSLARKVREAILAMRIEESLSKQRILELYLNEIYFGMQSYGVAAAAQAYFNKPLDELTIPEAAFLAALPKAPNNYNPFRYPEAAKARRDWVIDRMAEDRAITPAEAAAAKATPIIPAQFHRPDPLPGADWFAEEVRRRLIERFGAETTTQGGLMVRTSFDPALQAAAEKALRDGLMEYDRKLGGWRGAVGHVDTEAGWRNTWATKLADIARPPGMMPEWRLAVILEETDRDAKLGWLERSDSQPQAAPQPRTGTLVLADLAWARPVHEGHPGAAPRRMADITQPGDVLLVEPVSAAPPNAPERGRRPGNSDRVQLRQIPAVQGALVSIEPATGRVLAMVGGWSYEQSQFNRATQAVRQPGSSFKPIVYLTALEQGISPSTRFLDAPIVIGDWRPNNYDVSFNGPTPLRIALQKSLNLVTLRVAQRVGMEAVAKNAIAFHVVDNMPRVLPAALGAVDTTVLRMA